MKAKYGIIAGVTLCCVFGLFSAVRQVQAEPKKHEISIAIYQSPTHEISVWNKELQKYLGEMSGNRLVPKIYDSAKIAKGTDMLDAVQRGLADMGFAYGGFIASTFPVLEAVGSVPFLFRSDYEWWKAWPRVTAVLQEALEKGGYSNILLIDMPYYGGWYKIATKGKKLKVPADLEGLKLKAVGTGLRDYVKMIGGNAVGITTAEVYEAASRGLLQGTIGVHTHWTGWKQMEVFDHLLDLPICPTTMHWVVNKSTLKKLGPELAPVLINFCRFNIVMQGMNSIVSEDRNEMIASEKMEFYRPTAEEAKLWYAPGEKIIEEWVERSKPYGAKIVDIVKAARASESKGFLDW